MTVETLWVILVAVVVLTLVTGILAYFKGFRDGAEDSAEFIAFLKRSEEKESEDTNNGNGR
jgi:hypothetical protein